MLLVFSCSVMSCSTLCDPINCSIPGFPVLHCLPELAEIHFRWVSDAIQQSHPLSPASSPALSPSQHQGLFQWVGSWHQVAKVLEHWLQHQSFQWIFRVDFLKDWLVWSPCYPVVVAQVCPLLCDPMVYSPPGSSVHGISQARILEWVAISFSSGSWGILK